MSAFDKYIDGLVTGEDDNREFPKNESSWEELFEFGQKRIEEIVALKRTIARQDAVIEALRRILYGDWDAIGELESALATLDSTNG